jgi:hypothetical protein
MMGFSSAALSYMGIEHGSVKNLELAKHNIDVMCMLSDKTKGNLTDEEEGLLKELLLDLKEKFVESSKK